MYGKVFRQMYKGSMSMVGWEAVVTMQQLIILADKHGVVDMTPQAIAGETTIPLEIIQKGIALLLAPDPESRSHDEDGRRIVPLSDARSWGWQLVNHAKYRAIRDEEDRREYQRQYWHKRKTQQPSTPLNTTHADSTNTYVSVGVSDSVNSYSEEDYKKSEKAKRSSRTCPDSFVVTDEMRAWAATECPGIDVDRESAQFKDYTFASPKTDWLKTWRNWMRKAKPINGSRPTRYEELRKRAVGWNPEPTTNPLLIEVKR